MWPQASLLRFDLEVELTMDSESGTIITHKLWTRFFFRGRARLFAVKLQAKDPRPQHDVVLSCFAASSAPDWDSEPRDPIQATEIAACEQQLQHLLSGTLCSVP